MTADPTTEATVHADGAAAGAENDSPADVSVLETLRAFDAARVEDAWRDAQQHRIDNPRIAITASKELLESLCKHILDLSQMPYEDRAELPELYRLTARSLDLGPSQQSEDTFRRIFGACTSIVESVGSIRNFFGSAHGRNTDAPSAAPRHAELAVNLAGVMAVYLIKTWQDRQHSLKEVIEDYLADPGDKPAWHKGRRDAMTKFLQTPLAQMPAPKVASNNFIDWAMVRLTEVKGATVLQDLSMLSNALEHAREKFGLEAPLLAQRQAREYLRRQGVARASTRRERRLKPDEYVRIMELFRDKDRHHRARVKMTVMVDLGLETACTAAEICNSGGRPYATATVRVWSTLLAAR